MEKVEFIKLEDEIKELLIQNEKTRNDDMLLYYVYCTHKFMKNKVAFMPLEQFLFQVATNSEFRKQHNVKTFTAVERARRKIQAENPELVSDRVKRLREKEEESYKEYSRL